MRILLCCSLLVMFVACTHPVQQVPIDRKALVSRNNPQFSAFDSLASLSVGNGEFAFTVDVTGLQTFPDAYKKGAVMENLSQYKNYTDAAVVFHAGTVKKDNKFYTNHYLIDNLSDIIYNEEYQKALKLENIEPNLNQWTNFLYKN